MNTCLATVITVEISTVIVDILPILMTDSPYKHKKSYISMFWKVGTGSALYNSKLTCPEYRT